jgi:hypothetical protein
MRYMGKWCREASSNESKSRQIEHGGKSWQLRIVDEKPKNTPEVDMALYTSISENSRDNMVKYQKKYQKKKAE